MDIQSQLNDLQAQVAQLTASKDIGRDQETALRERLGTETFIIPYQYNNASFVGTCSIFVAPFPCKIIGVTENHYGAGTDAGAVTMQITTMKDGVSFGSGTSVLSTAFNLKSTAKTTVAGQIAGGSFPMDTGERCAVNVNGTLTGLEGVTVTLYVQKT